MLLNWWLIGWMAEDYYDYEMLWVFIFTSALLICVQSQVATTFLTNYLGQAMFAQRPTIWGVVRSTFSTSPYFLWVHGVWRMLLPAVLIVAAFDPNSQRDSFGAAMVFLVIVVGLGLLVRCVRPFACEILSLEKTPVFKKEGQISYGLRSSSLHRAANSELLGRFILISLISVPLTITIAGSLLIFDFTLNLQAAGEYLPVVFYGPLAMWIVAGILAVVRFLSYIDIRIRQEGWEVELRLRSEAIQLEKGLEV